VNSPRRAAASLNRRVSITVIGVTSGVVLIAAIAVWLITQSVLLNGVDRELISRADRLRHYGPMASPEFWRTSFSNAEARHRIERGGPNEQRRMVLVVVDANDGTELHRSSVLPPEADLSVAIADKDDTKRGQPTTKFLQNGTSVRVLPMRIQRDNKDNKGRDDHRGPLWGDKVNLLGIPFIKPPLTQPPPSKPSLTPSPENTPLKDANKSDETIATTNENDDDEDPGDKAKDNGVIVYVGLDLEQVDNELVRMAWVLAGLWSGATLLAFGSIRLLQPSVLRPASELAIAIKNMGPEDLTKRLPSQIGPTELHGVVNCLNGLFESLELAFKREQATIANIAHELRTPVASLRTALEFRQMEATNQGEREAITGYLDTVERMQTQVTNLLLLARLEAGKEPLERSELDLSDLVDEAIDRWQPRALARQQTIAVESLTNTTCSTSPDHFGLILDNLLSNAVSHGNSPGTITITFDKDERGCLLTVSNTYSGDIDSKELGQAYYRADSARSREDHCGLGLALCQRLCRLLGAELTLTGANGHFIASVRLPG
jgi:signal transduction histidine kinase